MLPSPDHPTPPEYLKVHGTLIHHARRAGVDLRLWYIARAADLAGVGWVRADDLLTVAAALMPVGRRSLYRYLAAGEGTLWTRAGDLLYLAGVATVAARVNCPHVSRPALVPVTSLATLRRWRAAGYAAYIAGDVKARPITRRRQSERCAVATSTQRVYMHHAPITGAPNCAVTVTAWPETLTTAEYNALHSRYAGMHGAPRYFVPVPTGECVLVGYVLPNTYATTITAARRGMTGHVNGKLTALLANGDGGNGSKRRRVFHDTTEGARKAAKAAIRRMASHTFTTPTTNEPAQVYARAGETWRANLWHVLQVG